MKTLALIIMVLALATVSPFGDALANCRVVGTVVATEMDDDRTGKNFNKLLVRTNALANNTFSFTTSDKDIMLAAVIAKSSQMEVRVLGDAASCPASGLERDGGRVLRLNLNP